MLHWEGVKVNRVEHWWTKVGIGRDLGRGGEGGI